MKKLLDTTRLPSQSEVEAVYRPDIYTRQVSYFSTDPLLHEIPAFKDPKSNFEMRNYYCTPRHFLYENESSNNSKRSFRLKSGSACAHFLAKGTSLKWLRHYPKTGHIYLYMSVDKYYKKISSDELPAIINKLLAVIFLHPKYRTQSDITDIAKSLLIHEHLTFLGDSRLDITKTFISTQTGLIDVNTRKLIDHDPQHFVTSYFPYPYQQSPTPHFDAYMEHLRDNNNDRYIFLMAVLKVVVTGSSFQFFVYLYGPGGSGKSTFTTLASALVGDESTHATTLRALNNDKFEASNFTGCNLIIVGDTENYTQDMSQLKALTGGDPLRGREMYKSATYNVYLTGTILITGNKLLNTKDASNALLRRIRPLEISKIPEQMEQLLYRKHGTWHGLLSPELSGIFYKVINTLDSQVLSHVKDFHLIASLRPGIDEAAAHLNPVLSWVREHIEKGAGSYVGFNPKGAKESREAQHRRTLYPAYKNYCEKGGSEKRFVP